MCMCRHSLTGVCVCMRELVYFRHHGITEDCPIIEVSSFQGFKQDVPWQKIYSEQFGSSGMHVSTLEGRPQFRGLE